MMTTNRIKAAKRLVTGPVLQKVAGSMLPFYRKIAANRSFAAEWTTAVVSADLALMGKLLQSIPALSQVNNYGTNGIGYFLSFPFKAPVYFYTNGTTIPPGMVQFTFSTEAHRSIAAAVAPLYRKLAVNAGFAAKLADAIRRKDQASVNALIRSQVKGSGLKSVTVEESGVALLFRTRFSKYP
ncbi:hypothetical protein [Paenibacillus tepidiphilus]|uniref:hypothetical protein n=1 Tax=Paenibacillus tepidiphilus TaxID=2608683 RepID=UPI001EEFF9EC|nr:hypothetical protein [Paenibacillus tepidiphilus]